MSDTIQLNDDLNNVELENDITIPRKLFIENISYDTTIFIFIIFILFNSIYVYAGTYYPSSINTTTIYYPLVQDYANDIATVKILLEPLNVLHKFIIMDGKTIRHSTKYPIEDSLVINGKIIYLKDGLAVSENTMQEMNITNRFKIDDERSSVFRVLSQPIYSNFNGLNISLVLQAGFYNIRGFEFTYTFSDTTSYNSLSNTGKLILSSTACYALIGFIFCLKREFLTTHEIYTLILGITAALAPNPLSLLTSNKLVSFLSVFLPIVFLTVYRSFQIFISISILNRKNRFSQNLFTICFGIVIFYEICEFCVSNSRDVNIPSNSNELTSLDIIVIMNHILYSIIICTSFGYSFYCTSQYAIDKIWHFKSAVYGIFSLATAAATLVAEVVIPINGNSNDSQMELYLYLSSHIFASIAILFLHHPVKNLGDQKSTEMIMNSTIDDE